MNIQRLGTQYGGKYIDIDRINKDSIIYSFGLGDDITFDTSIIERTNCNVFGFDPTPRSLKYLFNKFDSLPSKFQFLPIGISTKNILQTFKLPPKEEYVSYTPSQEHDDFRGLVLDINTIFKLLGHDQANVIKLDVEGAEYDILDHFIDNNILPEQLLVEFHEPLLDVKYVHKLSDSYVFKMQDHREFLFIKK